jgi:hypothetical protein
VLHDVVLGGRQTKVLAAIRNDPKIGVDTQHFGDAIGHQACTGDQVSGLDGFTLDSRNDYRVGIFH